MRGGPAEHDGTTFNAPGDVPEGHLKCEKPDAWYRRSDPVEIVETEEGPAEVWVYVGSSHPE